MTLVLIQLGPSWCSGRIPVGLGNFQEAGLAHAAKYIFHDLDRGSFSFSSYVSTVTPSVDTRGGVGGDAGGHCVSRVGHDGGGGGRAGGQGCCRFSVFLLVYFFNDFFGALFPGCGSRPVVRLLILINIMSLT